MGFGDVIRSASSPTTNPAGIGGDALTIWNGENYLNTIYELSTSDFSVIRSASSPSSEGNGTGGDATKIWHCDYFSDLVYELSTSDFSVVRSASTPGTSSLSIGGDATTIWHGDLSGSKIYELSTSDFSVIRSASLGNDPNGIGGTAKKIWCAVYYRKTYELSTSDLSILRSATLPDNDVSGMGGDDDTIWACSPSSDLIYELDAAITYTLSGTISDEWGNTIRDANITISNGTTYTTTSDENGAYSQVVDADTYDIAVSKSRSTFNDTSESITISSDTTRNITMTTDKIVSRQHTQGMSIIGGISLGRS